MAPQLQAIAAPPEDEDEEEGVMQVGKIAHKYLSDYAAKQNVDKTFGIYKNPLDKLYYIGNTPIDIRNNLIVGHQEYEGTPGLWELIISKQPDANVYSRDDFENYAKNNGRHQRAQTKQQSRRSSTKVESRLEMEELVEKNMER